MDINYLRATIDFRRDEHRNLFVIWFATLSATIAALYNIIAGKDPVFLGVFAALGFAAVFGLAAKQSLVRDEIHKLLLELKNHD